MIRPDVPPQQLTHTSVRYDLFTVILARGDGALPEGPALLRLGLQVLAQRRSDQHPEGKQKNVLLKQWWRRFLDGGDGGIVSIV